MRTIHKYVLDLAEDQDVVMPAGAVVLDAQMQSGALCIWAEVDTANPNERRVFWILGTGKERPLPAARHIATVQSGVWVWHVYEPFRRELVP
jgi:hypothetical protein